MRVLADTQRLSRNVGQAGNWTRGVLADIKRALTEAEQARAALLQELRSAVVPHVVEAMRTFALDWAAERRRQGALQFHDLLVLARDLLRDHPDVRGRRRVAGGRSGTGPAVLRG